MNYFVLGDQGAEYGPVDFNTLLGWVNEGRVIPKSRIKNGTSGAVVFAKDFPGLFAVASTAPPASPGMLSTPYGNDTFGQSPQSANSPYQPTNTSMYDQNQPKILGGALVSDKAFWSIMFYCALALVLNFTLGRVGIFMSGYSIYDSVKLIRRGHKFGFIALIISVTTFLFIIGHILFLSTSINGRSVQP